MFLTFVFHVIFDTPSVNDIILMLEGFITDMGLVPYIQAGMVIVVIGVVIGLVKDLRK
jgi:hypothetical protein